MSLIGSSISARAIGEAGLRALTSEWGGARPIAAGSRSGGRHRPAGETRALTPRR